MTAITAQRGTGIKTTFFLHTNKGKQRIFDFRILISAMP